MSISGESGLFIWQSDLWTAYSPKASFVIVHPYLPGDANGSGDIDIDDVVYLIAYIFSDGPEPCAEPQEQLFTECIFGFD